jgi:hypothetical protein
MRSRLADSTRAGRPAHAPRLGSRAAPEEGGVFSADGNQAGHMGDYLGVDCVIAREAISAMLDGEDLGCDPSEVGWHLAECAACKAWRDAAQEVTRLARLG